MSIVPDRAYTCTFLYPFDATTDTATYSVTLKAPDIGDTRTRGRNQNITRTKSGAVYVYDFGKVLSDTIKLTFTEVLEEERANLLSFFDSVVWGANKIKYIDYKGDSHIVRIYKNTVDEVNKGESIRGQRATTLYNFTLDLVDVSNNPQDVGDGAMPSQLAIHIADTDNPHDPRTLVTVAAADGVKVVDTVSVDAVKSVSWFVVAYVNATFTKTYFIHATHDGYSAVDATAVSSPTIEALVTLGTDPADIAFSVDLNGAGTAQLVRLKCAKAAGSVNLIIRRIKL